MKENKPLFNLTEFFSQRKAVSDVINKEIRSLRAKYKKEEKTTILFSLLLRDTIHLEKDIQKIFNHKDHEYPQHGLSLIAIEIVNISVVNNENGISFNDHLQLRFNVSDKYWKGSIPLLTSIFYDPGLKISGSSAGSYAFSFASKNKYLEVKEFIQSAKKQLREYI